MIYVCTFCITVYIKFLCLNDICTLQRWKREKYYDQDFHSTGESTHGAKRVGEMVSFQGFFSQTCPAKLAMNAFCMYILVIKHI